MTHIRGIGFRPTAIGDRLKGLWARTAGLATLAVLLAVTSHAGESATGRLRFVVREKVTGPAVAARVHLKTIQGTAVHPPGYPSHRGHFTFDGTADLTLTPGQYTYEVERGPEYELVRGSARVEAGVVVEEEIVLARLSEISKQGWWSGDLHIHRPLEQIELLARAEDLDIAPVITWWNNHNLWADRPRPAEPLAQFDGGRFRHVLGGEDEREGGALLFHLLKSPIAIAGANREYPSPVRFLDEADRNGGWIDIEKPFWWDVPVWLATKKIDSIGLANNHMCRDEMYPGEAWGRPRDVGRLPAPDGNGLWSQEIYYQILNAGLRISPSAGSASGVLPNPVGYNRVWVHTGSSLTWKGWWEGLKAGRSFVSNGPLLRVQADGKFPGHVFRIPPGKSRRIRLTATLDSREAVPELEVVRDGQVKRLPRAWKPGRPIDLGELEFRQSGWFLVRAVADVPHTFRFASSAPFYVELETAPRRVSRSAVQFFLDWLQERRSRIRLADPNQLQEVLEPHRAAERFWLGRLKEANTE